MYSSPDKSIDEQTVFINANGKRVALDRNGGLPPDISANIAHGRLGTLVARTDPVRVNVKFYLNDAKQVCISGPVTPGEGHLQRPPDRIATDRDKKLFAIQYQLFQDNLDQMRTGTLLDIIFPHDKAKIQKYYKANIYNIEQLADVNEAVIAAHPEISPEDKKIAQRFIRYQLYEKELQVKDEIIARLQHEIVELREQLSEQPKIKQRMRP